MVDLTESPESRKNRVCKAYHLTGDEFDRAERHHAIVASVCGVASVLFFVFGAVCWWADREPSAMSLSMWLGTGALVTASIAVISNPLVWFLVKEDWDQDALKRAAERAQLEADDERREQENEELSRLGNNIRQSPELAAALVQTRATAAAVQVIERDRTRDLAGVPVGSPAAATIDALYDAKLAAVTRAILKPVQLEDLDHEILVLTKQQQADKLKPKPPFDPATDQRARLAKADEIAVRLREVDKWEAEQCTGKESDEVKRIRRLAAEERMKILERR